MAYHDGADARHDGLVDDCGLLVPRGIWEVVNRPRDRGGNLRAEIVVQVKCKGGSARKEEVELVFLLLAFCKKYISHKLAQWSLDLQSHETAWALGFISSPHCFGSLIFCLQICSYLCEQSKIQTLHQMSMLHITTKELTLLDSELLNRFFRNCIFLART